MNAALVVLAAGASTRLGTCKALIALTPRTPLQLLLENGGVFDGAPPLVVSGADHQALQRALPAGSALAFNVGWERGRTGGVRLASGLRAGLDLCLAPVDVPLVPAAVFRALSRVWNAAGAPARGWLAPRCGTRFGHPIVVGRALLEELAAFGPDEPLQCLRERAEPLLSAAVDAPEIFDDLDSRDDWIRIRKRFGL
ncbi:MAG: NTP transferase domain-containing protein [Planctomycetes bacterium]|nr:NTP transferase domain-containing protein [Planctomycetota bacterium]